MKLTRKKAISLCIELWTWLAETGKQKWEWPEWKKYEGIDNNCWFCEYGLRQENKYMSHKDACDYCPICIFTEYENCYETFYGQWENVKAIHFRKKYAKLFLEQIESIEQRN